MTRHVYDDSINKPYRKLQVDEMPIVEIPEQWRYQDLLEKYFLEHGKPLKSVKRHKNSQAKVPNTLQCPRCHAPHDYLYDNTGGRGQFWCKICDCLFNFKNYYDKVAVLKCPHCMKTLEKIKKRKDYDICKCKNNDCSFYRRNLKDMSKTEKKRFQDEPHVFKMRYIFR